MLAPNATRRILWLSAFAVAFGLLESSVVVYLRELYYPDGFRFPIVPMPRQMAAVELLREATTILMLFCVAAVSSTNGVQRFFAFAYLFGIWDLVYYAGLHIILGWPDTLLTWDILFLIPVPWLSPVLYPMTVSVAFVAGFAAYEWLVIRGRPPKPLASEWGIACAGAVLVVSSFCWEWRVVVEGRIPERFPSWLFAAGMILGAAPLARAALRAAR